MCTVELDVRGRSNVNARVGNANQPRDTHTWLDCYPCHTIHVTLREFRPNDSSPGRLAANKSKVGKKRAAGSKAGQPAYAETEEEGSNVAQESSGGHVGWGPDSAEAVLGRSLSAAEPCYSAYHAVLIEFQAVMAGVYGVRALGSVLGRVSYIRVSNTRFT